MKSLSHYITEAFDSSYKFTGKKVAEDEYTYGFDSVIKVDGDTKRSRLQVDIEGSENANDDDYLIWDIGFSRKMMARGGFGLSSYDITGEGDALKIFSTVMKIGQDFVKKEDRKSVV